MTRKIFIKSHRYNYHYDQSQNLDMTYEYLPVSAALQRIYDVIKVFNEEDSSHIKLVKIKALDDQRAYVKIRGKKHLVNLFIMLLNSQTQNDLHQYYKITY